MFEYCEIIKGGVSNRGNIKKIPVQNYDLDYYGKEVYDAFHSVYMHTEDFYNYDDGNGGKRGYNGNIHSNYLMWDLDNGNDLNGAKLDAIELYERLMMYDRSNIRIYFSGRKGFHIYYICPTEMGIINMNEKNIKSACTLIASDLKSFDQSIYDKTRVVRTTNSKHSQTDLYKIPLTIKELREFTVDDILSSATTQRQLEYTHRTEVCDDLLQLFENAKKQKETITGVSNYGSDEILNGIYNGFNEGERNNGFTSLAGMLHARNIDTNFVYAICSRINGSSPNPLDEKELQTIVRSISRYSVDQRYVPVEDDDIVTIGQAADSWEHLIKTSGYTSFGDRFSHLNDRMKLCIPGDVIGVVASSGTGKTTIGMELANLEAKHSGKLSLCASLEMSRGGLYFRAATIEATELATNDESQYVPSSEVAKMLLDPEYDLRERVIREWDSLRIIDKGGLSLDKIVEYYSKGQELTKGRFSNLMIDYAQNLESAEDIQKAMAMYRRFKEVAKQLQTKLFVLIQTNKTLHDDYTEPSKNNIEGAGALYQALDYIIAAWRSRDYKNRLHSKMLKDRWGVSDYMFDFVRSGLKYHTEDYIADVPIMTGGL